MLTISLRTTIRSWVSGATFASRPSCSAVGSAGSRPGACRYGTSRRTNSSGASSRRWRALIASHFFRSKRAGLAFTFEMSKAATSSSIEKWSSSAESDQPSRAR